VGENTRCYTDDECAGESTICVRPVKSAALLRITVVKDGEPEVILWNGPKREVVEEGESPYFCKYTF
jgi:hypothetical protein